MIIQNQIRLENFSNKESHFTHKKGPQKQTIQNKKREEVYNTPYW